MSTAEITMTDRERELSAIVAAYNQVTEQLKRSHEQLGEEVRRLREELARKNEQLRRRDRLAALGEMAAGVAHEIRNPLGSIQLFASLLRRDLQGQPGQVRLVEKISKGVSTLDTIVSGILEFGRPSEPRPSRVVLGSLLSETVELAAPRIERTGVQVSITDRGAGVGAGAGAGVELTSDGILLQRALLNLLVNALDAAASVGGEGHEPRVWIDAAGDAGDWVAITVRDNGPGVPAELRERIFNPFFTTKDNGVGLGLAIVHQIAECLGGSVRFTNRAEGGAEFCVRLPREWKECGPGGGEGKRMPRGGASHSAREPGATGLEAGTSSPNWCLPA